VQPPVGDPVKVGKPVTDINVAVPVLTPVRLMVTVEAVDTTLLLNAMDDVKMGTNGTPVIVS